MAYGWRPNAPNTSERRTPMRGGVQAALAALLIGLIPGIACGESQIDFVVATRTCVVSLASGVPVGKVKPKHDNILGRVYPFDFIYCHFRLVDFYGAVDRFSRKYSLHWTGCGTLWEGEWRKRLEGVNCEISRYAHIPAGTVTSVGEGIINFVILPGLRNDVSGRENWINPWPISSQIGDGRNLICLSGIGQSALCCGIRMRKRDIAIDARPHDRKF